MLKGFWELIEKVIEFLRSKNKNTKVASITDPAWRADLAFLVSMTQYLNDPSLKLHFLSAKFSHPASL